MGTKAREENSNEKSYLDIMRNTFLFAGVQIVNILSKVVLNKVVAYYLGPQGVGIYAILQSSMNMLKSFFGFGISQSAIKDVAYLKNKNEYKELALKVSVVSKLLLYCGCFALVCIVPLSFFFSNLSFNTDEYSWCFIIIGISVFFTIMAEGNLAILKGYRELKIVAKITIYTSIISSIISIPVILFFNNDSLVFLLLIFSLVFFVYSWVYTVSIKLTSVKTTFAEVVSESNHIFRVGLSLMYVSFVVLLYEYLIRNFIAALSSIEHVGMYQAAMTILTGYFGIITTAMATDYFPRISQCFDDDTQLAVELKRQSILCMILTGPLLVIFSVFSDYILVLLYSDDFLTVMPFIEVSVYSVLFTILAHLSGLILIVKNKSFVFTVYVSVFRVLSLLASYFSYKYYGFVELGFCMVLTSVLNYIFIGIALNFITGIKVDFDLFVSLLVSLVFLILSTLSFYVESIGYSIFLKVSSILGSIVYSLLYIDRLLGLKFLDGLRSGS